MVQEGPSSWYTTVSTANVNSTQYASTYGYTNTLRINTDYGKMGESTNMSMSRVENLEIKSGKKRSTFVKIIVTISYVCSVFEMVSH